MSALIALERLAEALGSREIADDARETAGRIHDGRFFVACLGQFKRGKSTLLNTLVGAPVLPVGVTPVTAVVTVLRHGASIAARVRIGDGAWTTVGVEELTKFVSEIENPENEKRVTGVEVFVPAPLLAGGLCLVDTPGIGSVFEGNTEATKAFLPHVDAALVVLGADPPISGDELRLVATLCKEVDRIVFVLAKADRLRDHDEVAQAKAFTEKILGKIVPQAVVLEVSAVERADRGQPTREWERLCSTLDALARTRGAELVAAAEQRAVTRIARAIETDIRERRAALTKPREESEARLASLRAAAKQAERLLADAGPIFSGVETRLANRLEEDRKDFLKSVQPRIARDLDEAVAAALDAPDAQAEAIEAAQKIARQIVEDWRTVRAAPAEAMYAEAVGELVETASGVVRRVAAAGEASLERVGADLDLDTHFRAKPQFYFTEMMTLAGRSLGTTLRGALTGREGKRNALLARVEPYVVRLVETNSARATNDFIDQIRESRRKLERDVRRALHDAVVAIERALTAAIAASQHGERGIADEIARLDALVSELARIVGARE